MKVWPSVRLKECTRIVSGATPVTTNSAFWNGVIAWVTPKDLSNLDSVYISQTTRKITEAGLSSCAAEMLPAGSVLFSSRAPIGHVAINAIPMATNQGFKSFVPNPDKLFAGYLYWWLKVNRHYLESLGNGATFKEVSKLVIGRVEIALPPLDEQRRIAAILDQADALRRKRQRAIDRLNELGQSVFHEMFGTPVKGERRWPLERFSDVTDTKLGKMLDRGKFKGWTHYRYLRNANVRWFGFDLSDLRTMEIGDSEMERFLVLPGDLIICEGGEPGRCAVWAGDDGGPIFYQKALHRCRVNSTKLMPEYLCHLLWNFAKSGLLADSVTSATIAHLTGEKLARLDIPIPPIDLQREFTQRVRSIQNLGDCQKQHIAYLDGLFGSLQQRAFTGQL